MAGMAFEAPQPCTLSGWPGQSCACGPVGQDGVPGQKLKRSWASEVLPACCTSGGISLSTVKCTSHATQGPVSSSTHM